LPGEARQLEFVNADLIARRFGTKFVIWEDDRVKEVAPDEQVPEKRLLGNVGRLSRKIPELQAKQPNALELNDRPNESK